MSIDLEDVAIEGMYWKPTGELRWYRPPGGDDNDLILQQLWERVTGERTWRVVPTCLAEGLRKALIGCVEAWEALPGPRAYPLDVIQGWLVGPMKTAIECARAALKEKP